MSKRDARYDFATVREAARGHWRSTIFHAFSISIPDHPKRGGPCPICREGYNRFICDDLEGRGTWHCRKCERPNAGDGFDLVRRVKGWTPTQTLVEVATVLRLPPDAPRSRGDFRPALPAPCFDWKATALLDHADTLTDQSDRIFSLAQPADFHDWTHDEQDAGLAAVAYGYRLRHMAQIYCNVAFHVRELGLELKARARARQERN